MLLKEETINAYLDYAIDITGFDKQIKKTKYKSIYQTYKTNCTKLKKEKHSIFTVHCDELDMYGHTMCLIIALQKHPLLKKDEDNCIIAMYTALKMYEEPFDVYTTDLGYRYETRTAVDYDSYFLYHFEDYQKFYTHFVAFMHSNFTSFLDMMDQYTALDDLDHLYFDVAKTQEINNSQVKEKSNAKIKEKW